MTQHDSAWLPWRQTLAYNDMQTMNIGSITQTQTGALEVMSMLGLWEDNNGGFDKNGK